MMHCTATAGGVNGGRGVLDDVTNDCLHKTLGGSPSQLSLPWLADVNASPLLAHPNPKLRALVAGGVQEYAELARQAEASKPRLPGPGERFWGASLFPGLVLGCINTDFDN